MSKKTKKQLRTLLIALAVLALLAGLYAWLRAKNAASGEASSSGSGSGSSDSSTITVTDIDSSTVQALSYGPADKTLSFHLNSDGSWVYDGDETWPLNQTEMTKLVKYACNLSATGQLDAGAEAQPDSEYGLDAPNKITLTMTDGTTLTLELGGLNKTTGDYYLRCRDTVYTVGGTIYTTYQDDLYKLLQYETLPSLSDYNVVSIGLVKNNGNTVTMLTDGSAWYGKNSDSDALYTLDSASVTTLENGLSSIELSDCPLFDYTEADLAAYGLDHPQLHILVAMTDLQSASSDSASSDASGAASSQSAVSAAASDSAAVSSDSAAVSSDSAAVSSDSAASSAQSYTVLYIIGGATPDGKGYYVTLDGFRGIYVVSADKLDPQLLEPNALNYVPLSVFDPNVEGAEKLTVQLDGTTYALSWQNGSFTSDSSVSQDRKFSRGGTDITYETGSAALQALADLKADRGVPAGSAQLGTPAASIVLSGSGIDSVTLQLYEYDADSYVWDAGSYQLVLSKTALSNFAKSYLAKE